MIEIATPAHKPSVMNISCKREVGKYGRYQLIATNKSFSYKEFFSWSKWEGHCSGRLIIDEFVERAENCANQQSSN
jgi:hypothetical protein